MAARLIARINIGIRREQSASLLPDAVKGKLGWTLGKCLLRGTAAGTCGFTLEYVARTPLELHLRAEVFRYPKIPVSRRRRKYPIRVLFQSEHLKIQGLETF